MRLAQTGRPLGNAGNAEITLHVFWIILVQKYYKLSILPGHHKGARLWEYVTNLHVVFCQISCTETYICTLHHLLLSCRFSDPIDVPSEQVVVRFETSELNLILASIKKVERKVLLGSGVTSRSSSSTGPTITRRWLVRPYVWQPNCSKHTSMLLVSFPTHVIFTLSLEHGTYLSPFSEVNRVTYPA